MLYGTSAGLVAYAAGSTLSPVPAEAVVAAAERCGKVVERHGTAFVVGENNQLIVIEM